MKTAKTSTPAPVSPSAMVGDEVFFSRGDAPCCGKVTAVGKHGATIDVDGKPHRVKWSGVLGHKKRAKQKFNIIHEGEDGCVVEDATGKQRFIAIPPEAREDQYMVKSEGGRRLLIFAKAGEISNRPGLHLEEKTDKTGRRQKKWVRNNKDEPKGREPGKGNDGSDGKSKRGADAGYGTHNIEAGDSVKFKLGDVEGEGEVVGNPGADGAHVKDSSGHVHQVRWDQVTGHSAAEGTTKPPHDRSVLGKQEPIHPDKFEAAEFAKSHDQADVTPEHIISQFPEDTSEKIAEVQARLRFVEQTIDSFKDDDGKYTEARQALHAKIIDGIMSDERIKAATPADGEAPKFIILGGRGGSGKSWFEGNVYEPDKYIVLDADHIKGQMPEYEGWNAHQVHEESGEIFDKLVEMARTLGLNVVLDKTMKTAKSAIADVNAFKEAGYKTEAHYMHLPRQEAAKRAVARFLGKTKRFVPPEVVLSNTSNEHSFDQVKHLVDDWSFRDNNVQQGQQPILISKKSGVSDLTKALPRAILAIWRLK